MRLAAGRGSLGLRLAGRAGDPASPRDRRAQLTVDGRRDAHRLDRSPNPSRSSEPCKARRSHHPRAGTDAGIGRQTDSDQSRAMADSLTMTPLSRIARLGRRLDDRSRRIALAALAGGAQRLAAMVGTLMIFPQVLHALGRDQFGVWGAAISMVMMITIADFGPS
jgi:hypothetical protein